MNAKEELKYLSKVLCNIAYDEFNNIDSKESIEENEIINHILDKHNISIDQDYKYILLEFIREVGLTEDTKIKLIDITFNYLKKKSYLYRQQNIDEILNT